MIHSHNNYRFDQKLTKSVSLLYKSWVSYGVRLVVASLFLLSASAAQAWTRTRATTFGILPDGAINPEGITADAAGNIYATTFGVARPADEEGHLVVFGPDGRLLRDVRVAGSSRLLLGLDFHPTTHDLLVLDFGAGKVRKVNPNTGASTVFFTPPATPGTTGLNAITFDNVGNVYVSDSFLGTIWRSDSAGGHVTAWITDPLLKTTGFPPFGANGLNFNKNKTKLFVANTGDDTVVQIPFDSATQSHGVPSVFVNSINGADGLILDRDDNLWVCANQADEIVIVEPSGKVIGKLADFVGVDRTGKVIGLLFPASLVFSGDFLYVTNLALDLRLFGLPQSVDSQWAAQVTKYTVSRIRARIPEVNPDEPEGDNTP
jgi:sugar lactone lactonase YvrE